MKKQVSQREVDAYLKKGYSLKEDRTSYPEKEYDRSCKGRTGDEIHLDKNDVEVPTQFLKEAREKSQTDCGNGFQNGVIVLKKRFCCGINIRNATYSEGGAMLLS